MGGITAGASARISSTAAARDAGPREGARDFGSVMPEEMLFWMKV